MKTFFSANDGFLAFEGFLRPEIRCGITTKNFGDCNYYNEGGSFDQIEHLGKNLHASEIFVPFPQHKNDIITAMPQVGKKKKSKEIKINPNNGDAIILRHNDFNNHRPLILHPTADCPIVVVSGRNVSALIHCGWRGLHAGILSKVVSSLTSQHLLNTANAKVIIWPGICQEHYQISQDIANYFPDNVDDDNHLNLQGVIHKELLTLDFSPQRIGVADFCSFHSKKDGEHIFSSHRRNADPTRNVVFMLINLSV